MVTKDVQVLKNADKLILPGVGAFGDAAEKLRETKLDQVIIEEAKNGKPLLGICLGMQLLFDCSYEYGKHDGLGLISGEVKAMEGVIDPSLKIPHIGWNALAFKQPSVLFKYIQDGDYVYFVHSYAAVHCDEAVIATSEYDMQVTAAVQKGRVYGCQFHPEKSGEVGLNILRAFCEEG